MSIYIINYRIDCSLESIKHRLENHFQYNKTHPSRIMDIETPLDPPPSSSHHINLTKGNNDENIIMQELENCDCSERHEPPNIWNEFTRSTFDCICGSSNSPASVLQCPMNYCYRCGKQYHSFCYWPKVGQSVYQCPYCYLRYCMPNYQVYSMIFCAYFHQSTSFANTSKQIYQLNFNVPIAYFRNQQLKIQLRCIKISDNRLYHYTNTWPEKCQISINDKQNIIIEPMSVSSPLQRRYDESINVERSSIQSNLNKVTLTSLNFNPKFYKSNGKGPYIISIMIVRQRNKDQIVGSLDQINKSQSRQILKYSFDRAFKDVEVDGIKISAYCQFFGTKIVCPARTPLCTHHYQPFDALNMISASLTANSSSRKWKCPICNKRAYHIIIDGYLHQLFNLGNIKQVWFKGRNQQPEIQFNEECSDANDKSQGDKSEANSRIEILNQMRDEIPIDSMVDMADNELEAINNQIGEPQAIQWISNLTQQSSEVVEIIHDPTPYNKSYYGSY